MPELFAQDAFIEAAAGVVQHDEIDTAVHADVHALQATKLGVVGNRARRAQHGFEHFDFDLGSVRQEGAAPAPWSEG